MGPVDLSDENLNRIDKENNNKGWGQFNPIIQDLIMEIKKLRIEKEALNHTIEALKEQVKMRY